MSGLYKNNLQTALLYEKVRSPNLYKILAQIRADCSRFGVELRLGPESDTFATLLGLDELELKLELVGRSAPQAMFARALSSPLNLMSVPDAADRVARHTCVVLLTASHGTFGDIEHRPELQKLYRQAGFVGPGLSFRHYLLRVKMLQVAASAVSADNPPSLVHWAVNDLLVAGNKLALFCNSDPHGLPTVHPFLFRPHQEATDGTKPMGFLTAGAASCIGYELHVDPAPVPWAEQYEAAMAFIKLATMDNGYLIPDGETFGNQADDFSYRVRYLTDNLGDNIPPRIRMTLQYSRKHDYRSPEFEPRQTIAGGVDGLKRVLGTATPQAREAIAIMADRVAAAERVEGRIVASVPKTTAPLPPGSGKVITFGRRRTN